MSLQPFQFYLTFARRPDGKERVECGEGEDRDEKKICQEIKGRGLNLSRDLIVRPMFAPANHQIQCPPAG
jgi:hypothetical protein